MAASCYEQAETDNSDRQEKEAAVMKAKDTYVEMTDDQWDIKFYVDALKRWDRIENDNLTITELIQEQEDGVAEAFAYFLGMTPERQQRSARKFKEMLAEIRASKERSRQRALRMIERGQYRDGST